MSSRPAVRRASATYADLQALPEHVVGEIVAGELIVSPRPGPRHAVATSVLGGELGPPYHGGRGGPGGWWDEEVSADPFEAIRLPLERLWVD